MSILLDFDAPLFVFLGVLTSITSNSTSAEVGHIKEILRNDERRRERRSFADPCANVMHDQSTAQSAARHQE